VLAVRWWRGPWGSSKTQMQYFLWTNIRKITVERTTTFFKYKQTLSAASYCRLLYTVERTKHKCSISFEHWNKILMPILVYFSTGAITLGCTEKSHIYRQIVQQLVRLQWLEIPGKQRWLMNFEAFSYVKIKLIWSLLISRPILVGTRCQELPNKEVRWTSSVRSIPNNFVS
jgi:hypothetical protein